MKCSHYCIVRKNTYISVIHFQMKQLVEIWGNSTTPNLILLSFILYRDVDFLQTPQSLFLLWKLRLKNVLFLLLCWSEFPSSIFQVTQPALSLTIDTDIKRHDIYFVLHDTDNIHHIIVKVWKRSRFVKFHTSWHNTVRY